MMIRVMAVVHCEPRPTVVDRQARSRLNCRNYLMRCIGSNRGREASVHGASVRRRMHPHLRLRHALGGGGKSACALAVASLETAW
jgi:hypothetical protein